MSKENLANLFRDYLCASEVAGQPPGKSAVTEGPVITIFRAVGARCASIAELLVKRLAHDKTVPRRRFVDLVIPDQFHQQQADTVMVDACQSLSGHKALPLMRCLCTAHSVPARTSQTSSA